MHRAATLMVSLCLVVLASAGCTDAASRDPDPDPGPVEVGWRELALPAPPGPAGRIAVRDGVRCGNEWYVVGAVFTPAGETRPAGWRSRDGETWTLLEFDAEWFWAQRNVLSSVACHDGVVAMIGARSGGAHGNPRTSTWERRPDGVFVDVKAPFNLYGGPLASSVNGLVAGDPGWLISGNRLSGAAVWTSPPEQEFTLHEDRPALAHDPGLQTLAVGAAWTGDAWAVVGGGTLAGRLARVPLAWTSTNGVDWRRLEVEHGSEYADLHRVLVDPAAPEGLALGVRDGGFGAWKRDGDRWAVRGSFAQVDPDARAAPFVTSAVSVAGSAPGSESSSVLATLSDGASYAMWASSDAGASWRRVAVPSEPTTAGDHIMAVAASGSEVLLLADDGTSGRAWLARWPG